MIVPLYKSKLNVRIIEPYPLHVDGKIYAGILMDRVCNVTGFD